MDFWSICKIHNPSQHPHLSPQQVRLEQVVAMDVNFTLLTRVWCVAELVEADHLHISQVRLRRASSLGPWSLLPMNTYEPLWTYGKRRQRPTGNQIVHHFPIISPSSSHHFPILSSPAVPCVNPRQPGGEDSLGRLQRRLPRPPGVLRCAKGRGVLPGRQGVAGRGSEVPVP